MKFKKDIKRFRAIVMTALLAVLLMQGSGMPVYAALNEGLEEPKIDSKAAELYSVTTEEIVFAKNADKRVDPYSTTKLMTALLAAENLELDRKVTVKAQAVEIGESTMWLQEGEVVTVEQLLYGALIESGNDAAYTLGVTAGDGSYKKFIQMMNDKAAELGCTHTHFANPHGLQDDQHYTTAEDFLLIARAAFENETVRKIAGTAKYDMPATNMGTAWTMKSHTDLLTSKDSGVIAGKTGYWEDDDCSVALDYDKDGLNMILVLFQSDVETRAKDAKKLFAYGRTAVVTYQPLTAEEVCGEVRVRCGEFNRVEILPAETVLAYPKSGDESAVKVKIERKRGLEAPIAAGEEVGTISVSVDGHRIAKIPALAATEIRRGWLPSYFYITNQQTLLIGGILLVLLALILRRRYRKKHKQEQVAAKREVYRRNAEERREKHLKR
ncbi:MAG: D-alanyl-D-alanine carboxypeptidase [Mogibacterium sp.]|nr:D-alanyl-D-alanine carboxypeptidase [Mogibacterium sp.]